MCTFINEPVCDTRRQLTPLRDYRGGERNNMVFSKTF